MSYIIGIDLGTGSVKGLVLNKKGNVIEQTSADYPLLYPQKGYSEQCPADWIQGTKSVIQELVKRVPALREELTGISFSGQMHSLVLLDAQGEPVRNAILWNDVRTTEECSFIKASFGEKLLAKTKNRPLEGFTLPKILWVKEHESTNWERAESFLLPKDYLAYWLTGIKQMELSDAAGTLLLNVMEQQWDLEIAEKFGISEGMLPSLNQSMAKVGELQPAISKELGLPENVAVFSGGADNACAALGAGIISENQALVSIGTSGVFLSYEGQQERDYAGKLHFFNHVIPASYYSMGVTLAAGQSLTWYKETFAPNQSFTELMNKLQESQVGARGLLFTPYIMGERTPYVDSQIRGSFIGIDANHQQADFIRAVVEGITFSLKDTQELMQRIAGKSFTEIISVGGGAKNEAWLQIQADIFNTKICTLKTEQGPGLGAAMIAAMGLGWFETIEDCVTTFVHYDKEYLPSVENVASYQKFYQLYQQVYAKTKGLCHDLAALTITGE